MAAGQHFPLSEVSKTGIIFVLWRANNRAKRERPNHAKHAAAHSGIAVLTWLAGLIESIAPKNVEGQQG